jgi:hypothetical protein
MQQDVGLDGFGVGADLFISQERHGRDFAGAMAFLAASLEDGFDILVEGDGAVGGGTHE